MTKNKSEKQFWDMVYDMDTRRIAGENVALLQRKDIPLLIYLKTRFLTPSEIIKGFRDPVFPPTSLKDIIFNARYNTGKAIPGYDFH